MYYLHLQNTNMRGRARTVASSYTDYSYHSAYFCNLKWGLEVPLKSQFLYTSLYDITSHMTVIITNSQ